MSILETGLQKPQRRRCLNLVVVGKSGVGKSSFLNYAAGREVFATGAGDPVTQTYFQSVDVPSKVPGIIFSLFDTKGIENDNTGEWLSEITGEINRRDRSTNIYDWFHTILYCISAGDKRVEDFDIAAIKKLMQLGSVIVVLTKKDQATAEQLAAMTEAVTVRLGGRVQVYAVCNGAATRAGTTQPSGLDAVLHGSFIGLWEKAARVVPRAAMDMVTTMNHRMVVADNLASFTAMMALTAVEARIFPDLYHALRLAGIPYHRYKQYVHQRQVPEKFFRSLEKVVPATFAVDEKSGLVDAEYVADARRTFFMPSCLGRGELRSNYYRKALMVWASQWAVGIDDFYRMFEDDSLKRRFLQAVEDVVGEILMFYNDLTGSHRNRLVQTTTVEMLDGLSDTLDVVNVRKQLTSHALRIGEEVRRLDSRWIRTEHMRMDIEWRFMALAADAARQHTRFADAAARITEALQTELRAYGQYFLMAGLQGK